MQIWANSPLDQFESHDFIAFSSAVADINFLSFTNFSLYSVLVFALYALLHTFSNNLGYVKGNRWSVANISIYDTIENMTTSQIGGSKSGYYFPMVYSLFIGILIANLISMIPYSVALSAQLYWVIMLSVSLWLGVTILGLFIHKWEFFGLFVPAGTPLPLVPVLVLIELLSYAARAISLGLRLGANTLSGHLLMVILSTLILGLMSISIITFVLGLIPVAGLLAILALEFAIAMIQAYVFVILACSYIKDSLYLH